MSSDSRERRSARAVLIVVLGVLVAVAVGVSLTGFAAAAAAVKVAPQASGALDCNGFSPIQQTIKTSGACTDVRGFAGVSTSSFYDSHFYDNGHYIGHDEPDLTFLSSRPGSGNDVSWTETLPRDPASLPTATSPGNDVSHWFELTLAPWFSMALCNSLSFPQLPCVPNSDANAPACLNAKCPPNSYPGGGSSFLEMQFYPPGDAPFADSVSCDNSHWCASLHINDLECTASGACNGNCIEPTNFAFVQRDGTPTGPPSPQLSTLATSTPNSETLLMSPGDKLSIHIFDAPAPGGGHALEVSIDDLTSGQTGFMQASAANGFTQTSINDCSGTYFNYEPEYSTAKAGNVTPWTALQANISTEFEIGHFEPCTSVTNPLFDGVGGAGDPIYGTCNGPYEASGVGENFDPTNPETSDAPCYPNGDTHGTLNSDPNEVAGCLAFFFQNGDLDFDGSDYYRGEWPTSSAATAINPGSFVQTAPTTGGHSYAQSFFQTDGALSESTCTPDTLSGCTVPPSGPGGFYPYWSETTIKGKCTIEFGNVASGTGVYNFRQDAQYGSNQFPHIGYSEFESKPTGNTC